jgi:hypothetical protein
VSLVLTSLERALRSHQLYEGAGHQYQVHLGKFWSQVTGHQAPTIFNISPFGPYPDGAEAPQAEDPSRLWFELFEEGVRQITLSHTVAKSELDDFLRAIGTSDQGSEDALTRLWRRDLPHIHTHVVRRLTGVSRTPTEAKAEVQGRLEYWHSSVVGIVAVGGIGSGGGNTLVEGDVRTLAASPHTFNWCQIGRAPGPEDREIALRPKLSAEIDRNLADIDRFFEMCQIIDDQSDALTTAVIKAIACHGSNDAKSHWLEAVEKYEDTLSTDLVNFAKTALTSPENLHDDTATVDVFENTDTIAVKDVEKSVTQQAIVTEKKEKENSPEAPEMSELDMAILNLDEPNPRVACDAVNTLFRIGSTQALEAGISAHKSTSASVRNLVLVHTMKLVQTAVPEEIASIVYQMIFNAFDNENSEGRAKILRLLKPHVTRDMKALLLGRVRTLSFKTRSLEERLTMIRLLGQGENTPEIIEYLSDLLLTVRLFSTEDQMAFQTAVAKCLIQSDAPQARLAVAKVLKGWTVPQRVKKMIKAEVEAHRQHLRAQR